MRQPTRRTLFSAARARLAEAGIEGPDLDARVLLKHALSIGDVALIADGDAAVCAADAARLEDLIGRRLAGEPVARIIGSREFWGMEFALSPETLVPRPDTEILVESVLAALAPDRTKPLRILDFGTGTGCILIALLHELPDARGLGVDISEQAAKTACGNAARLGVSARAQFVCGDWGAAIEGRFDVVISNPPYLRNDEIAGLAREVRAHDPVQALASGQEGLEAYRRVVADARRLLAPGGLVGLELGAGQEAAVAAIAEEAGFVAAGPARRDLGGIGRAFLAYRGKCHLEIGG